MARIQNKNLPWQQLRLRSGRVVQTDGDGVLEGITDEEANWLGSTPGWKPAGPIGEVHTTAPATVSRRAPQGVAPAAKQVEPPPAPESEEESASEAEEASDDGEEEGPDVDAIRSKAEALRIAEQYGVEGLSEDMKLADMKAKLHEALYGGE